MTVFNLDSSNCNHLCSGQTIFKATWWCCILYCKV